MIKKVNLTVLTNPLIFNSDRAEMLISNACVGFDSLDITKYSVDLKFLFWNSLSSFNQLCDTLELNRSDNFSLEWENFNYGDLKKILDVTIKNIKEKDDRLDILNKISVEISEENYQSYDAQNQFKIITNDIRSSVEYDMYFWMSSRYIFNEFDYLTHWVNNFEKYPKLPFYCNWPSFYQKLHSIDFNVSVPDNDTEFFRPVSWTTREQKHALFSYLGMDSELFIITYGSNHILSVRPREFIQFIERDLFDEGVLEYCKFDENENPIEFPDLTMHLGSNLFGRDGIRIKNRKNIQGKCDDSKERNTVLEGWTVKHLIEDYYAFLSKPWKNENGDVKIKGCYEDALQFFILFEQYMIKSGYKKFDIDLIDLGSIKIPTSSMDGIHHWSYERQMRSFLWESFIIFFEFIFYLNDKLNLNFSIEKKNEYEIINKVYDSVFEKKQMNGIKDVFKKIDIYDHNELVHKISNIFKEFIIYKEKSEKLSSSGLTILRRI